ncbi:MULTISPECIES: hypothetical protein [Streptomyces]|uniref:Lipoprotein n=1 Tax=Streptomyces caniscabiei TaxID=2746961 RepID=A0ABU4MWF3_9ACTN|nr:MULTISPECIES: hypothetical protein [Streptomyces]MBE4739570.1 hypothetical protein [Streptomyces caniscabiei]MBE4760092.1 hypothetical protein [Streptomyces caniscabiei]MBE4772569.1 hypothetical protein [Streptomyces caniscabiei]MBE4784497.1 hypothetical protein [Streptomyces caniscabiei]MBE4798260.1 hypothetical protein [Streptomyces caniscabiei]
MRTRVTALLVAAVVALTACTSDDEPADKPGDADGKPSAAARQPSAAPSRPAISAADTAGLEAAVRAYNAAYFANDPDSAHSMLSARCRKQITPAGMAVLTERAEQTEQAIGDSEPKDVKRFEVDEISGDEARVSYGVGIPKFDQKQEPWVREAGVWRYDSC